MPPATWGKYTSASCRGIFTDVRLEREKNERIVTFYDGTTARERMISVDDAAHRVAWTIIDDCSGITTA